jgi:peptidoglycan pentaglycine glycine transferase (the first glycine)
MAVTRREIADPGEWDKLVLSMPNPHLLQSWLWGQVKQGFGWTPRRWSWDDDSGSSLAVAQILQRALPGPLPLSVLYCPKGPLLGWDDSDLRLAVVRDLETMAAARGVIQLKIDPDLPLAFGLAGQGDHQPDPTGSKVVALLESRGWAESDENIQFANTMILDLRPPESALLAAMKQKTRYNIRLAARKGVEVRLGAQPDLDLLFEMYAETSIRDGFVIRPPGYYRHVWGQFVRAGLAQPLIAEVAGEPVAAVIVFAFGSTAWYLYGMSRQAHREKMPNYLLQWEAIRWARARGCLRYDLWGAPDTFDESDPMWGVYRFKDGFGARVMRGIGAWDKTVRRPLHLAYAVLLPRLLSIMRRRGRQQTADLLD